MATTETWVLDGVALTSGNFDILELTADPPKARADWITAADSEGAALLRQPQHENRTVTMKLRIAAQASMNAALDQIGVIRDKLRLASATADGIDLVWTPANSTRAVTFDVLGGEIPEMPIGLDGHAWSWFKQRPVFTIELTCKPYWYGVEVTTSTASSSTPFVTIEVASVPGDVPALGRLIVTDTATQNRRHVEWGVESQYYNSGTSLLVDSDNMTVMSGIQTTRTGAYDPNAAGNNVIRATVYSTPSAMCTTGVLSHVGTFRVKARVWASSSDLRVRLTWQAGDGPFVSNPYATPSQFGYWTEVDLGIIVIPPKVSGTQRWSARVEALSFTNGDSIDVDYLILVPAGEGYGKARAAYQYEPGTLAATDDFLGLGIGTALNTRVTFGGPWATSGSATDFVGNATFGSTARRSTAGDTGFGRFAVLATAYTDTEVRAQVTGSIASSSVTSGYALFGVLARYVDANNWLTGSIRWGPSPALIVTKNVAGVQTNLAQVPIGTLSVTFWVIRMLVWSTGAGLLRIEGPDGDVRGVASFFDSTLATGGALATGKTGIVDYGNVAPAFDRDYDVIRVYTPPAEPIAMYSGRTIEFRHNETLRQDSTATYYGRPASYRGTRFTLQPGTNRVLAKARRLDVEVATDESVTDGLQIQVAYTPRGLVIPR